MLSLAWKFYQEEISIRIHSVSHGLLDQYFHPLPACSIKEAYEKLQNASLEQKQGLRVTDPKQTVKQYLEYLLEHVHKPSIKLNTYIKTRELLDLHILSALGHLHLHKLTIQHAQVFHSKLQEKSFPPAASDLSTRRCAAP